MVLTLIEKKMGQALCLLPSYITFTTVVELEVPHRRPHSKDGYEIGWGEREKKKKK